MSFQIKKAIREKIFVKLALMGASGSGKTYSALRIATGMKEALEKVSGKKARILLANTEQKRGYYYANEFDYDIVDINAPHNPEKYVDLIDFAVQEKYDILIVDSTSHEWEGKGGCLELHSQAGGRYQDWGKITPRHNKFIEALAESPIHLIATMRGKDQYVMSQEEGKQGNKSTKVEKVGVGAKQRDGFEYEFTCTFLLDQKMNTAEPFKDNTHIFENDRNTQLSEAHGKKIIEWANSGDAEYTPVIKNNEPITTPVSELETTIKAIDDLAKELAEKVGKDQLVATIKDNLEIKGKPSANYNAIKDVESANNLLKALKELGGQ